MKLPPLPPMLIALRTDAVPFTILLFITGKYDFVFDGMAVAFVESNANLVVAPAVDMFSGADFDTCFLFSTNLSLASAALLSLS